MADLARVECLRNCERDSPLPQVKAHDGESRSRFQHCGANLNCHSSVQPLPSTRAASACGIVQILREPMGPAASFLCRDDLHLSEPSPRRALLLDWVFPRQSSVEEKISADLIWPGQI